MRLAKKVVIPNGDVSAEADRILAWALRMRLRAMCLMVVKFAGA
jgi:hypothetical protein